MNWPGRRPSWVAVLLCCWILPATAFAQVDAIDVSASPAAAGTHWDDEFRLTNGTPLTEVLQMLRDRGVRIVWSELLVRSWMRIAKDSTHASAAEALQSALAPFDLKAKPGPGDTWLVVRDKVKRDQISLGAFHGRVVNAATGEPVQGAQVQLGQQSTAITTSDGRFHFFPITMADYALRVDAPAYRGLTRTVRPEASTAERLFELAPEIDIARLSLEDVLVVASRYDLYAVKAASSHFLSREDIERLPHLADDSNRALHRIPGVAAGDWSARFHLRGGLENEVSLVVDGLELFDPFHMKELFSPLSIVDANVIQNTELYSGGFGARFGDHMSGVIQIDTLEAGTNRENEIGVSFVNAYGRSQGPFADQRGRWLVSARRGYLDLLVDQIDTVSGEFEPRYYDVFAKADYEVSDRLNIAAHILVAADSVVYIQDDDDTLSGDANSDYAWVSIRHQVSDALRAETVLSVGQVERNSRLTEALEPNGEFAVADSRRETRVAGIKMDWEWLPGDRHMLTWGAELRNLDGHYDYSLQAVTFGLVQNDGMARVFDRSSQLSPDGDEMGAYLSHRFRATDSIVWETGLRWDKQTYTDLPGQTQWSPRINLLWAPTTGTEIRLAWGRYYQPQRIDELQVEDGVEHFFPAQRSTHQIFSLSQRLTDNKQMRLEVYRKDYDNVRPRFENVLNRYEVVAEVQPDRVRIAPESSLARGVELSYKHQINERWEWWGAYTWSRVEDRIDGRYTPRNWDQRNALTAVLNWHTGKWNVNMTYLYHSGWPTTDLEGSAFIDRNGEMVFTATFDEIGEASLGAYHRFDLRATRSVAVRNGEFRWFFEVYNLFDTGNDCCVTNVNLFGSITGGFRAQPELDRWMPRLPSIGFSWTF